MGKGLKFDVDIGVGEPVYSVAELLRLARIDEECASALAHYDHIVENIDMEACVEQLLRIIDTN